MIFESCSISNRIQKMQDQAKFLLTQIETFLLPSPEPLFKVNQDFPSTPLDRLDETLYETSLADHIRSLQAIYRDNYDEQCLGVDLRPNKTMKMPIKFVLDKIVEGRLRANALLRLSFGDRSYQYIRGLVDASNAYALQGLWIQANDLIDRAIALYHSIDPEEGNKMRKLCILAARRISLVFRVVRQNAMNNCGFIKKTILQELLYEFQQVVITNDPDEELLEAYNHLILNVNTFLNKTKSKLPIKQLTTGENINNNKEECKTWGNLVEYLRTECPTMRSWFQMIDNVFLPQNKAMLLLPFRLCDPFQRQLAHPIQLANQFSSFPFLGKLFNTSNFHKVLFQIPVSISLFVDVQTGQLINQTSDSFFPTNKVQNIIYELPIPMEEYLTLYIQECSNFSIDFQPQLLKLQIYNLKGLCLLHSDQISLAEEILSKGINELSSIGCEMEMIACDLYNTISQVMLKKHEQWTQLYKNDLKKQIEEWIQQTEEGKKALKNEVKKIHQAQQPKKIDQNTIVPSFVNPNNRKDEIEQEAKGNLIRKRVKEIMSLTQNQPRSPIKNRESILQQSTILDDHSTLVSPKKGQDIINLLMVSYRYLAKSYEIMENYYQGNANNPALGIVCINIASIYFMLKELEDAREWLLQALRIMEKCSPSPVYSIAFIQQQLSNILCKLGYNNEGYKVLLNSLTFYLNSIKKKLTMIHNYEKEHPDASPSNEAPYSEYVVYATNARPLSPQRSPNGHPNFPNPSNNKGNYELRLDSARSTRSNNSQHSRKSQISNISPRPEKEYEKVLSNQDTSNKVNTNILASPIIIKNSPLEEELQLTINLLNQIIRLNIKNDNRWEATLYSEELVKLYELVYGWDHVETAESYRSTALKCVEIEDWIRATKYFSLALQSYQIQFVNNNYKQDAKYLSLAKAYEEAKSHKNGLMQHDSPSKDKNGEKRKDFDQDLLSPSSRLAREESGISPKKTSPRLSPRGQDSFLSNDIQSPPRNSQLPPSYPAKQNSPRTNDSTSLNLPNNFDDRGSLASSQTSNMPDINPEYLIQRNLSTDPGDEAYFDEFED